MFPDSEIMELGYPASEKKIDLTNLSQEELHAYNRFKSNYDEED